MKNDLPKVHAVKIEDNINNSQEIYYSNNTTFEDNRSSNLSIESKINKIFNSPNYIYKKEVLITTSNTTFKKTIIGRKNNYLITYDNELIDIDNIIDIQI